jgi:hypothetical protein
VPFAGVTAQAALPHCGEIAVAERKVRSAKAEGKSNKHVPDAVEKTLRREMRFVLSI